MEFGQSCQRDFFSFETLAFLTDALGQLFVSFKMEEKK
jgi:hypothetical protein